MYWKTFKNFGSMFGSVPDVAILWYILDGFQAKPTVENYPPDLRVWTMRQT